MTRFRLYHYCRYCPRQSGVALITVLLVIFLASVTAVSLAALQQLSIRRSAVLQHQQQAHFYVLGAEQWALQILTRDRHDNDTDHLGEDWAQLPPALPLPGGRISGRIEDLQGRFNLNNLLQAGQPDEIQLAVFRRLLRVLELDGALAQIIVDWIDADRDLSFPDGAEDSDYLNRTPAYLAANQPLRSLSELRLLKGIDQEVYAKLSPYVSVLPAPTAINVNTAPAELLTALSDDLDTALAEQLVEQRGDDGFADIDAFLNAAGLAQSNDDSDNQNQDPSGLITLGSDYFLVDAEAVVGDSRALLHSLLQRTGQNRIEVLLRSFGLDH